MTAATISFNDAIQRVGFGRFQKKLMILCGLGWAADAMEILLISFALPSIGQEWNLSNAQKGLLSTAIFLGMLVGAYVWGRLSDKMGRKVGLYQHSGNLRCVRYCSRPSRLPSAGWSSCAC